MYKVFMFIGKKKTIKRPCFFSGVIEINLGLLQDNYHAVLETFRKNIN